MSAIMQRSFAGGELGPALWARADQVKYQTGLRICRNFLVQRFGGVTNRAGTAFVCEVDDSTKRHRLAPFVFNADQTYVLAFGDLTLRFLRAGAQIETSPGVPYSLVSPYSEAQIATPSFVQSGDVVTIAHHEKPPYELKRTAHTAWTLTPMPLTPAQGRPTALTGTPGAAGTTVFRYRVTAISPTYEESLPAVQAPLVISGATRANPCTLTITGHTFLDGEDILVSGVVGMTELNGNVYRITGKATNTVQLLGIDSTAFGTYVSGGTAAKNSVVVTGAAPTSALPHVLNWTAPTGAWRYNIYKEQAGIYGYVGTTEVPTFKDTNYTPATSYTPPGERNVFTKAGDYPGTVTYYQQRLAFANTLDEPEKVWMSRTGQFTNFTASSPIQSDDAVSFTLAGRQVNAVRHLVEVGTLIALTAGGEHTMQGDSDGVLRPTAINPKQQGYSGAAEMPAPVVVGNSILFVQARGTIVRDLRYDFQADGYQGHDLTVFAPHLFDGQTIVAWAYQQVPHSVVWAVRGDGVLLGLTYLREHEVSGWHRHDTGDGDLVEDVCVVPEGDEDAVYLLIRRLINGTWKRYVERMASRRVSEIAGAIFLDASLSYDGRNTGATTLTLTGGTSWGPDEALILIASAAQFVAGDVGNAYVLTLATEEVWCSVTAYTSPTQVSVLVDHVVPVGLRAIATTAWSRAVDEVANLAHLEGRTVGILADGNVLPQQIVASGAISLSRPYRRVTVGLPIVAEVETLDLENVEQTLVEKRKRINRVSLLVESSRGIWAGPDRDHLREYKQRSTEAWGVPTALRTGQVEIPITSTWTPGGSLVIRQTDPLPLTVLAIAPGGEIGS